MKTHGILKGARDPASLDIKLSMSVKKKFVDALVKIMLDNKYKTRVDGQLCNGIYLFTYDMKRTKPGEFSDSGIFYVNNFQDDTSIVVEVQLQS